MEILEKGLDYCLKNPSEFAKAYKDLFKEEICSYCPGKIEAKFHELNNNKNKLKTMQQRKYRMIPGKLIDTSMGNISPSGMFTDKNITDEIAEKLIAQGYGKYFIDTKVDISFVADVIEPVSSKEEIKKVEEEAEIVLDVYEKKNSLDTYSRSRLAELCEKRGYPKEEWMDLVRKDLIKYVNGK